MTKLMTPYFRAACSVMAGCLVAGCGQDKASDLANEQNGAQQTFAINLGGQDYLAADGTNFVAGDKWVTGGVSMKMDTVLGTPDKEVYKTYRRGELAVKVDMPNGVYDVTLIFAEPRDIKPDMHVYDVVVEEKTVLPAFDAYWVGKGKRHKAYARTLPKINIKDGQFDLHLKAITGSPVISAIVARPHVNDHAKGYKLLWADEFDTDGSPDPSRWNYILWGARKVNDEDQVYTNFTRNVRVKDGHLILEAHKEDHRNGHYTSGRITSEGHGDLLYGRVEVRAKLPFGGGTWPAIWMYPTDRFKYSEPGCSEETRSEKRCVAWPHSGEFDIMEHVGNNAGIVHSTIHTKSYYWVNGFQRSGTIQLPKPRDRFHTYALNWTPERMEVFMDDTLYFTYVKEAGADWKTWPFDHPYHLILNLAVGGWWGRDNGGIDETAFPQRMEVDYVRFYTPILK